MKKIFFAALAFVTSCFALQSCGDDAPKPDDFSTLAPGLYVTTVDTAFAPLRLDSVLNVDKYGGFFARSVNVFPHGTRTDSLTWTVDSMTWEQIDTTIVMGQPADTISFKKHPWDVDQAYKLTYWMWVERAKPWYHPERRPMIVKLYSATIVYPRRIKLYLSQKPYSYVYHIDQAGLLDQFVDIHGRSERVADLPTVKMKSVRQPDGTFVVSRAD